MNSIKLTNLGFLLLALTVLGTSCSQPLNLPGSRTGEGKGAITVRLGFSADAKTVVPDFKASVDLYSFQLTNKNGFGSVSKTITPSEAAALSNMVEVGGLAADSWDLKVEASCQGTLVASTTVPGIVVSPGQAKVVPVSLAPDTSMTGTARGGFSLKVEVPVSVTALSCSLLKEDGSASPVQPGAPILTTGASTQTATVGAALLPAGRYSLVLTFTSGTSTDVFREAVNVFPGLTSNRWVGAGGALLAQRTFLPSEFGDSNAHLQNLVLNGNPALLSFVSATTSYTLTAFPSPTLSFQPASSAPGQSLTYSWNGTSKGSLNPDAASPALALISGTNTLEITVKPPQGLPKTYTLTFTRIPVFQNTTASPEMVLVPGGSFSRDGTPANVTTVSPFLMGRFEVTQAQYQTVMGTNPSQNQTSPLLPVETVSWYGALAFCNRLSLSEGLTPVYRIGGSADPNVWGPVPTSDTPAWNGALLDPTANGYRLPTEMEWWWAAMGATADSRPGDLVGGVNTGGWNKSFSGQNGSNTVGAYAWTEVNAASTSQRVGQKLPNELGIYDMSGNVWEFTQDGFLPYPPGSVTNFLQTTGTDRAAHGGGILGGWSIDTRGHQPFPYTKNDQGFRVVRNSQPLYTVTYDANAADSGSVPSVTNRYPAGTAVPVLGNTGSLVKAGYTFAGWVTSISGPAQSFGIDPAAPAANCSTALTVGTTDVRLFAVWIPSPLTFTAGGLSITVTGPKTVAGNLIIPQGVTALADGAFQNPSPASLTSVYLPDTVTNLGNWTFRQNTALTSVTLPSNLTSLGTGTFFLCTGLTSISFPPSLTSIGDATFSSSGLTTLTIPKTLTALGTSNPDMNTPFAGCLSLTAITVDAGHPAFLADGGVLYDSTGNTLLQYPAAKAGTSPGFRAGVTAIGKFAFFDCKNFSSVAVPEGVVSLGGYVFTGCPKLSLTLPATLATVDPMTFYSGASYSTFSVAAGNPNFQADAKALYSKDGKLLYHTITGDTGTFTVPEGVETINRYAFHNSPFSQVLLPSTLKTVGKYAFIGLPVTSITIPAGVTGIGDCAFQGCALLTTVTVLGSVPPTAGSSLFGSSPVQTQILVPSVTALSAYRAASGWSTYSNNFILTANPTTVTVGLQ